MAHRTSISPAKAHLKRSLLVLSLLPSVCWTAPAAGADFLQSVETELQSLIGVPPEQLISTLRFFSASNPSLDMIVVWQAGERISPPVQEMLTFSESHHLAAHGRTFDALRSTAKFQKTGLVQSRLPGSSTKGIQCWQNASTQAPLDICVLGQLPQPAVSSVGPAHRNKSIPASWGFSLITALCVLGFLIGIHRKMREWEHDIRQPLSNLNLNLALLPRYPAQRDRLHADMALELQKLDKILSTLTLCLPRGLSWNNQTQAQQSLNVVLGSVIDSYRNRLHGVGCVLRVDLAKTVQQRVAVASLQRIGGNVIDNCIRHAPGSVLTISTHSAESSAPCTLIDFACTAIPSRALIKPKQHSGLGLRSSRRLALKHNWQWAITRTESEFRVSLRIPMNKQIHAEDCTLC